MFVCTHAHIHKLQVKSRAGTKKTYFSVIDNAVFIVTAHFMSIFWFLLFGSPFTVITFMLKYPYFILKNLVRINLQSH